jgi:hypothetical protein
MSMFIGDSNRPPLTEKSALTMTRPTRACQEAASRSAFEQRSAPLALGTP